ncbi:MAG: PLDc N-terminal domain-containing protein [Candidatus Hermodarchaeota archaeon]
MLRILKKKFLPLMIDEYTSENFLEISGYGNTLDILWIIVLIWFILGIFLALWVYKDAQKRVHNENIWIIIVLFLSIIGFLIYIFFREEEISIEEEIDHDEEIQIF